jgi:oligopeptidase B
VTLELHGDSRVDDYYWLRERENPEVISYLEAENVYTEQTLSPFAGLQGVLYEEMKSRIKDTSLYYSFFVGLEGLRELDSSTSSAR